MISELPFEKEVVDLEPPEHLAAVESLQKNVIDLERQEPGWQRLDRKGDTGGRLQRHPRPVAGQRQGVPHRRHGQVAPRCTAPVRRRAGGLASLD